MARSGRKVVTIEADPVETGALGGGLEGAERTTRETVRWEPSFRSPDQVINPVKDMADARSRDIVMNDGYANGVVALHRDNIVGAQYRLNAQPNWVALGVDEQWAEEFQQVAEARFNTIAESQDCWLDASRRNTFTGMMRLGVASFLLHGEILAIAEWIREARRPFQTAIQHISPTRMSNPDGRSDDKFLRKGLAIDARGRPTGAWVRKAHPTESFDADSYTWTYVPWEKPWGRKQVIHIIEQLMPHQSRGISDMVAVLKQMKMTKKFQEVTLQNAVVNATYAAAIESELPTSQVFETLGAGVTGGTIAGMQQYLGTYMGMLSQYLGESKQIAIDGAKIPHLFPGTKLHMQPVGTPGGVGTEYEMSLLRHIAACLGLSYEQFSRDYTNTNYSSARASANETWKFMQGRKKMVVDRYATMIYQLWLEEDIAQGNLPLPAGKNRNWFYEPLVKDALSQCSWIGASRGQIDEKKETEAAIARIEAGLSTYEYEAAKLGMDWRELYAQRAREQKLAAKLGVSFGKKASAAATTPTDSADNQDDTDNPDNQDNPDDTNTGVNDE